MSRLKLNGRILSRLVALIAVVALFVAGALVGRNGDGEAEADSASQLTLRAADMNHLLRTFLTAAQEDQTEGYRLRWSNFLYGPPIIAGITGGSVDVGWMAETPMIFSQAAGSPIKVIAVSVPRDAAAVGLGLVVSSGSAIRSVADLKGKKVLHLPGSILQYALVQLLEKEGLTLQDVQTVSATAGLGTAAELLEKGTVDAAMLLDPYLVSAEFDGKVRVIAGPGSGVNPGVRYFVASASLLDNEQAREALADFVARVARTYEWQADNLAQAAEENAKLFRIPLDQAEVMTRRSLSRIVPIDDGIIAAHQQQSDTFARLGLIRQSLDAREIFDTRFNDVAGDLLAERGNRP